MIVDCVDPAVTVPVLYSKPFTGDWLRRTPEEPEMVRVDPAVIDAVKPSEVGIHTK